MQISENRDKLFHQILSYINFWLIKYNQAPFIDS